jgi:hypothetical protein
MAARPTQIKLDDLGCGGRRVSRMGDVRDLAREPTNRVDFVLRTSKGWAFFGRAAIPTASNVVHCALRRDFGSRHTAGHDASTAASGIFGVRCRPAIGPKRLVAVRLTSAKNGSTRASAFGHSHPKCHPQLGA